MIMANSKLYLSGPMTGLPNLNREAFNAAAKTLRKKGYKVINPPELDKNEPQRSWEACLKRDIRYLLQCDKVATLPGWKKSKGANLEVYIAKQLKYLIRPYTYFRNKRRLK
jgi:Domain of unknown function (DUF4406)